MTTIQVFDPPMCCATGFCGPGVDPALARFAADLEWLRSRGLRVERFNLAQQPGAFTANPAVREALAEGGTQCLPLILVDGKIVGRGSYPAREALRQAASGNLAPTASRTLRVVEGAGCPAPAPGAPKCC